MRDLCIRGYFYFFALFLRILISARPSKTNNKNTKSKKTKGEQKMKDYEVNDAVEEIKDQDLEGQEAGAGIVTGIKKTIAGECFRMTIKDQCGYVW